MRKAPNRMSIRDVLRIRRGRQAAQLAALVVLAISAAKADRLDTISYNFQVDSGGGGASALWNQIAPLEIYCNDFNNDIWVPAQNYSATLSDITPTTLGATRFGQLNAADFHKVAFTDADSDNDADVINNADAYARYEMAAYLVSQYDFPGQGDPYNSGIQLAIWEILDPTAYGTPNQFAPGVDPSAALEMAADWYSSFGTSDTGRQTYLADYRIVSDTTMVCAKLSSGACDPDAPLQGGFQEQITRVPEPAASLSLAFGLIGFFAARRRTRQSTAR